MKTDKRCDDSEKPAESLHRENGKRKVLRSSAINIDTYGDLVDVMKAREFRGVPYT